MGNPVASVGIDQIAPTDTDITLNWSSFDANGALTAAANSANATLTDVAGNKKSASCPVNGRSSSYVATVSGLTPGTVYTCICDADGVYSPGKPGCTTGNKATAHLVPKKDDGDGGVEIPVSTGDDRPIRVKVVKINDPQQTPMPGVMVYFAVTDGSQYGSLESVSAVSNDRGIAKVLFDAGNTPGDVEITASSPLADNTLDITVHVRTDD
jgi:hypothetical protein